MAVEAQQQEEYVHTAMIPRQQIVLEQLKINIKYPLGILGSTRPDALTTPVL